jgi:hypothetical protein
LCFRQEASDCIPPDLYLPNNWYYRHEPLRPDCLLLFFMLWYTEKNNTFVRHTGMNWRELRVLIWNL